MKNSFYQKPEIKLITYSQVNIITDSLLIEEIIPGDGTGGGGTGGGGTGGGDTGDWGWPY